MSNPFRLGVVFTHPTQHHSPLWRKLNEQPGIEVTAFYLCNENQSGGDRQLGSTEPWDVDLLSGYDHRFLKTWTGKTATQTTKGLLNPALIKELTPENFDAVFLSSFYTLSYRLTIVLCKLRGIPVIMQNDATIITDAGQSPMQRLAKATLYPWMYGLADHWIASGDHNEIYLRHYGVTKDKIVRGCYPVDRDRYETTIANNQDEIQQLRQELCWNEDTILYGFTGKYIDRKNPFEFIDAVAQAHQVDSRVRGIMIGGGVLTPEIDRRLASLNGEVVNVGFVNQSKLPLYYAAMDVFVATSLSDPHPLVISEAMSAGTPPILSDRCGNWGYSDTVQHRHNGLVYPCGNLAALKETILTLTDTELRRAYSQRSLEVFAGQDLNFELEAFLQLVEMIKCDRTPNQSSTKTIAPKTAKHPA
ncbi:MAG: glycosyltransferase family 4 protein [Cyanobacteria bacterium P01_H01_bin.21]